MTDRTYRHRAWQAVRRQVLERDHWECQIRGPRCTRQATEVDHVVPWRLGGARYDLENLRAACKACNVGRVGRSRAEGWRASTTKIVLVWGPPAVNKTVYVAENATPGDLIIDYDRIVDAIVAGPRPEGVHDLTLQVRNLLLRQVRRGEVDVRRVWIVSSNEQARDRFPFHESIRIDAEGVHVERVDVRNLEELTGRYDELDRWFRQEPAEPSRDW